MNVFKVVDAEYKMDQEMKMREGVDAWQQPGFS